MTKQARRKSSAKALAEQVDSLTGSAYVDIESVEDSPVADDSSQCSDDNATSDLDPEHEYVPHRDDILNAEETQQDTQIDQPTPDLGDDEDYDAIMAYDVGEDYLALNPSPTRFAGSCASSGASMSDATSVFIDCDDSEEELDETLDSHVPDDLTTPRGSIHQPGLVVSNLHILSDFEDSTAEQPKAEQVARKDSFKYIESSLGKPSTPQMSQILPPRKRIEGGNAFAVALTDFWGSLRELFTGIPGPREMWDDASPQAVGAVATLLTMLLLSTLYLYRHIRCLMLGYDIH